MRLLTLLLTLWILTCVKSVSSNSKNEEIVVFSFKTHANKTVSISIGAVDSIEYIVYRFGTDSAIELEYPGTKSGSFAKFTYSYYMRGGEKENEGIDLNYLEFCNNDYVYTLYQEYSAVDNTNQVGIKIRNEKTGKQSTLKGNPQTLQGSLIDLRFDERIPRG